MQASAMGTRDVRFPVTIGEYQQFRRLVNKTASDKTYTGVGMWVRYQLLDDESHTLTEQTAVCFGTLPEYAHAYENKETLYLRYNPLWLRPEEPQRISNEMALRWVDVGTKLGIFDSVESLDGTTMVACLDTSLVPELYMQLCWLRWIREAPGIVHNSLLLIDTFGCDPWAAVLYTHRQHVVFADQSLLPFKGAYATREVNASRTDLGFVLQLRYIAHAPARIDDREYRASIRNGAYVPWGWNKTVAGRMPTIKPRVTLRLRDPEMLLLPELQPIIACGHSGNFKRAVELARDIDKSSPCVKFEEISEEVSPCLPPE